MSSNSHLDLTRATSAPPMAEHVGGSMFANAWGSYGNDSPNKSNPRIPSTLHALAERPSLNNNAGNGNSFVEADSNNSSQNHIAQPMASRNNINNIAQPRPRNHPGTIGTPVHMSEESRPKSGVDLIQEDFPRTPSPLFANLQHHPNNSDPKTNTGYNMSHLQNSMSSLNMQHTSYAQRSYPGGGPGASTGGGGHVSPSTVSSLSSGGQHTPPRMGGVYSSDPSASLLSNPLVNIGNSGTLQMPGVDMQQHQQFYRQLSGGHPSSALPPGYEGYTNQQPPHHSSNSSISSNNSNNYNYNEVLFNARGEPVGYGSASSVPPPTSSNQSMLNFGGLLHQQPYQSAVGLGMPGFFDTEDSVSNRYQNNNNMNLNIGNVARPEEPLQPRNTTSSQSQQQRLQQQQLKLQQQQQHQQQANVTNVRENNERHQKNGANSGGNMTKKKAWGGQGVSSHYENSIELNRQNHTSGNNGRNNGKNHHHHGHNNGTNSGPSVASLLEEIRTGSNKGHGSGGGGGSRNWDVNKLKGNIVNFCKDQHGSRFIQQKLEIASDDEKKMIFHEVLPNAKELMIDVFGNYVIQKLFEYGTLEQRNALLSLLLGNAIELSMQMYGCRVVQKAFEVLPPPLLVPFVKEFSGDVLECVHDQNGNHVIQKCIEIMSASTTAKGESMSDHIQFIIDAFLGQVKTLASHPYGCRVVQRVLEHCCPSQKFAVLDELLHGGVDFMVKDQYGNYVVQHIIQYGRPADRAVVVTLIRSDLFRFAQHKFASNVVEKCVQFGGQSHRSAMIDEMISGNGSNSTLMTMIKDQYANYVIQKVIDLSDGDQLNVIANQIRENLNLVRKSTYGKHIITRLEKATGLRIDHNRSY